MRLPSEPFTSITSPGRTALSTSGAKRDGVGGVRAAPRYRQTFVQPGHRPAAGEDQLDFSLGNCLGQGAVKFACPLAKLQHVAEHGDATARGLPSTARAARIEAGFAL